MSYNIRHTWDMTVKGPMFYISRTRYGWALSVEGAREFARELTEWADEHDGFEPFRCGERTTRGKNCRNVVWQEGGKCYMHVEPVDWRDVVPRKEQDALESIEEALKSQEDMAKPPSQRKASA